MSAYRIVLGTHFATADGDGIMLTVEDGTAFQRVGILNACTPAAEETRWLVGELDGVRVYLYRAPDGSLDVLLTKRDVYPTERTPK